jgi:hypothetical protein
MTGKGAGSLNGQRVDGRALHGVFEWSHSQLTHEAHGLRSCHSLMPFRSHSGLLTMLLVAAMMICASVYD